MIDGEIEPNEPVTEETANLSGILSGDSGEQAANIIGDLNAKPTFLQEEPTEEHKPEVKIQTSTISPVEIGEKCCIAIMETVYSLCRLAFRVTKEEYIFDQATINARGEALYQCFQLYHVPVETAKILIPITLIAGVGIDIMECRAYAKSRDQQQQGAQQKEEVKAP